MSMPNAEELVNLGKLAKPASGNIVPRPRLYERLDASRERRVTVVTAPAGYGKTALLAGWQAARPHHMRAAWLTLTTDDNAPAHFWSHLWAALRSGGEVDLPEPAWNDLRTWLRQLINALLGADVALQLILDDFHHLTNMAVHRDLVAFVEQMPASLCIVILTRNEPPLPLARWRVRGLLYELDERALAFTSDEANALLAPLSLEPLTVAALVQRTEGWAAALFLARLAWEESPTLPVNAVIGGAHRNLADYFAGEVIASAASPLDDFLLPVALLERWSAPLCDAVLQRTDSRTIIAHLERCHLFVTPLDAAREWYRFHPLFVEYLRHRLQVEQPSRSPVIWQAAAAWFAGQRDTPTAIRYWLLGGDEDAAADAIASLAEAMIDRGEAGVLLNWLEQLSDAALQSRPQLNLLYTWALLSTARWDLAEARLRRVEQQVIEAQSDDAPAWAPSPDLLGQLATTRATIAMTWNNAAAMLANLQEARQLLGSRSSFWQCAVAINLGLVHLFEDRMVDAVRAFADAVHTAEVLENPFFAAIALGEMGSVHLRSAQLGQAADAYQRVAQMERRLAATLPVQSPMAPAADFGLGRVAFAHNQLDLARTHLERAIELSRAGNNVEYLALCHLHLAEVLRAQGDSDAAYAALHLAEQTVRRYNPQRIDNKLGHIAMTLARFWLADGNLDAALRWSADNHLSLEDELDYARALDHLTLARIMLTKAQHAHDVILATQVGRLLDRLLAAAQRAGRSADMIEIHCLQSLLADQLGNSFAAMDWMDEALALAEPEDYVRGVLDFGDALLPIVLLCLQEYGRQPAPLQRPTRHFLRRVLAGFGLAQQAVQPELLPPSLTVRELELLRLIAAAPDLSNREIARRLTVSVGTVKTHFKNIYAKLDAHSRAEAVINARRQKLV